MNLQENLKWIHEELELVNDATFIAAIKNMLEYRKKVSQDRISLEQYNKEIAEAIEQINTGKTFSQDDMRNRINLWANQ